MIVLAGSRQQEGRHGVGVVAESFTCDPQAEDRQRDWAFEVSK